MRYLIIILLLSSCVSTEKLLETKPKYQVRDIEATRESRKHPFKTRTQWKITSIGLFIFTAIVITTKGE